MAKIAVAPFGSENAQLYTLTNSRGMQVSLTNFGARLVDILLPIDGQLRNVSLA
ncbi:galactose-1-epimerase, partial [Streptococcus pyogenes]